MNKQNYIFVFFLNFVFFCLKSYEFGVYSLPNCENKHGNEDRFLIQPFSDNSCFFCVFDGHSGDIVSNYLSQNFVSTFFNFENLSIEEKLKFTFHNLDEIFLNFQSSSDFENINNLGGSTAIVTYLINGKLFIANLGDSRAVWLKDNEIMHTIDHKVLPNNEEARRILAKKGILSFEVIDLNLPRYNVCRCWERTINSEIDLDEFNKYLEDSSWKLRSSSVILECGTEYIYLRMSRAFGDLYFKPYGVIAKPDIYSIDLNGDEFLIIASDGFWDVFSITDAISQVLELKSNNFISSAIAENLCLKARMRGSTDDITVIIVFFEYTDSSSEESSDLSNF